MRLDEFRQYVASQDPYAGGERLAVYVAGLAEELTDRLTALERVAAAARVLVSVNEGFMDTVWQADQWGPLEKALEALDKE